MRKIINKIKSFIFGERPNVTVLDSLTKREIETLVKFYQSQGFSTQDIKYAFERIAFEYVNFEHKLLGAYVPFAKVIRIDERFISHQLNDVRFLSIMVHEMNHAIQLLNWQHHIIDVVKCALSNLLRACGFKFFYRKDKLEEECKALQIKFEMWYMFRY